MKRATSWADLRFTPDPLYVFSLFMAGIAGQYFSLKSVGHLLGFNSTTLWQGALFWSIMSVNWITSARRGRDQFKLIWLAGIPIALRVFFQMPIFEQVLASSGEIIQLGYLGEVVGLWNLVSVHEEAFRAAALTVVSGIFPDAFEFRNKVFSKQQMVWVVAFFANTAWVLFHFLQRPLDLTLYWKYILWLYCSGFVFTYALMEGGLGVAVWVHTITNLTA